MIRLSLSLVITLAVVALAGCASSPKADFYTLSQQASGDSGRPVAPLTVLVGQVSIPELVDRPQIVTRAGENHVTIDEFARWADPLKSQIPRVVAADLSQLLNSPRVSVTPMSADPTWRVRLDIQRFDADIGEAATVDVLWSVLPPGKASPITGRTTVREPAAGAGYDPLVSAWSRGLATVSRDIASAIRPASP